jgi:hypothetical protein
MTPLLKPITGLRILTLSVTILLIAVLFVLPRGSAFPAFLVGAAIGLSIGAQTMIWNRQLQWHDEAGGGDNISMKLSQPRR